ncbi:hypothetical protein BKA67DRAFT_579747 [Truncatella angustata]|uniref:Uncharacterized protein n=1 Tax=Truncatella angustata TaxID=152316 RepID=A0A9P8UDY8_9PEZI|nr:uncharacterized protein BKA67DRAFT_579747 [Truncatella angustata]KAH6648173.1 hypothetical protein BKA67DRAFT_579747 [Truncatella angustata]
MDGNANMLTTAANRIAGTDSVATTVQRIIICLMLDLSAYRILTTELDDAMGKGSINSPVQSSEAKQLPYLQAVVRESMRIYPGGTPLSLKQVPAGGYKVASWNLLAGT